LRRKGADVEILEQTPELSPVGAGLLVQPNAMLALRSIALDRAVEMQGKVVRRAKILREDGTVLSDLDLAAMIGYLRTLPPVDRDATISAALISCDLHL
jgi:2-polyprenyl-6-methoxyphenol hydroxylase-like FAD-dependent oxidoreductase